MEQLVGADHGMPVWHDVSYCPVIVDDQVCFVTATLTPIDDRKKVELALRASEMICPYLPGGRAFAAPD